MPTARHTDQRRPCDQTPQVGQPFGQRIGQIGRHARIGRGQAQPGLGLLRGGLQRAGQPVQHGGVQHHLGRVARIDQQARPVRLEQPGQHPPRQRRISHGMAKEIRQPVLGVAGQRHPDTVKIKDLQLDLVMGGLAQQRHRQFGIGQTRQHPRPLPVVGIVERNGGKIIQRAHVGTFPSGRPKG